MPAQAAHPNLDDSVAHLLSLGLTQLSIQVTLSTSLTASALGGKRRLTAATFGCLLLSALLIGVLNVGNQATLGSL